MRRFYTALTLLLCVFVMAACAAVKSLASAGRVPAASMGSPVTYEARPTPSETLTLQPDGTYTVIALPDSQVIEHGTFAVQRDSLKATRLTPDTSTAACHLSSVWLTGNCVTDTVTRWRQKPQRLDWPPSVPLRDTLPPTPFNPPNTTSTASPLLGERLYDLDAELVTVDADDLDPSVRADSEMPDPHLLR